MSEAMQNPISIENRTNDPSTTIMQIYEKMRGRGEGGRNNLISAIEHGGRTEAVLIYEQNKNDTEFPPEKPSERDTNYSDLLVSMLEKNPYNVQDMNVVQAMPKFREIRERAREGEASNDDLEFVLELERTMDTIVGDLTRAGYGEDFWK